MKNPISITLEAIEWVYILRLLSWSGTTCRATRIIQKALESNAIALPTNERPMGLDGIKAGLAEAERDDEAEAISKARRP